MSKFLVSFIVVICSIFNEKLIKQIITKLYKILDSRYKNELPKDKFKKQYPNYRDFNVDPLPPIKKKS